MGMGGGGGKGEWFNKPLNNLSRILLIHHLEVRDLPPDHGQGVGGGKLQCIIKTVSENNILINNISYHLYTHNNNIK